MKILSLFLLAGALAFNAVAAPFTTTSPDPAQSSFIDTNYIDVTGAEISAVNGTYHFVEARGDLLIYAHATESYFIVWNAPGLFYWGLFDGPVENGNVLFGTTAFGFEQLTSPVWALSSDGSHSTLTVRYRIGHKPLSRIPFSIVPPIKRILSVFHFSTKRPEGHDKEGERFWARAHITNPNEKAAIKTLVLDLKKAGIWQKLYAFYPFCGGTAQSCAQNLVADQLPIEWYGTVTFVNGVTGDGSTGYGEMQFGPGNLMNGVPVHDADQFNFASFRGGTADGYQVVFGAVEQRDVNDPAISFGREIVRDNGNAGVWMSNFSDWRKVIWTGGPADAVIYADSDFDKNQSAIGLGAAIVTTDQYLPNLRAGLTYTVLAENRSVFNGTPMPGQAQRFFSGTVTCLAFGAPLSNVEIPKFMTAVNRFLTTLNRIP